MAILASIGIVRLIAAGALMLCWTGITWMLATWHERENAKRRAFTRATKEARDDLPELLTQAELDEHAERLMRVLQAGGFSAVQETYSAPDAEERMARSGMSRGGVA